MFIKLKASFHFSAVLYGESKVVVLRFSGIMSHLSIWAGAGVGFIHTTLYIQHRSFRLSWSGQQVDEGYEGYYTIFYTVLPFYSDLEKDYEEVGMEDNDKD